MSKKLVSFKFKVKVDKLRIKYEDISPENFTLTKEEKSLLKNIENLRQSVKPASVLDYFIENFKDEIIDTGIFSVPELKVVDIQLERKFNIVRETKIEKTNLIIKGYCKEKEINEISQNLKQKLSNFFESKIYRDEDISKLQKNSFFTYILELIVICSNYKSYSTCSDIYNSYGKTLFENMIKMERNRKKWRYSPFRYRVKKDKYHSFENFLLHPIIVEISNKEPVVNMNFKKKL